MASPEPQQADADAEGPPALLCESSCLLDFTQLSPSKFGISTKSFAQSLPSSLRKGKVSGRLRWTISPFNGVFFYFSTMMERAEPSEHFSLED